MSEIEIEILTSLPALKVMEAELSDLVGRAGADYSHEPAFLIPWFETAEATGQRPACLTARTSGQLAAFLPLCTKPERKALFATRLAPPRIGSSPAFDLILDPGHRGGAMLDRLAAALSGMAWSFLDLKLILADSLLAKEIVPRLQLAGFQIARHDEPAYFKVDGLAGLESFWASRKSRPRIELRRIFDRCTSACEFACYEGMENPRIFDLMQVVLRESWKDSSYLRCIFFPMLERQFRALSRTGQARVHFVFAEGQPISFLVEFLDRDGTTNAYYNGMNRDWSRFSPGVALFLNVLQLFFETGAETYRFWGARRYIKKMSTGQDEVVSIRVVRTDFRHAARIAFFLQVARADRFVGRIRSRGRVAAR